MAIHGSGAFSITGWDEAVFSEVSEGSKLAIANVTEELHGTIEGTGRVTYLITYLPNGDAVFTGTEQVEGTVDGRPGSFVVVHDGTVANARSDDGMMVKSSWSVVPGSSSGRLAGLVGRGSFVSRHGEAESPYRFDYEIAQGAADAR